MGFFFRTDESKKTRLHVGGGIRLELVGEGDLYLECLLSENYSVFVQSFYLDAINNHKFNLTGSTAHKFRSGANTKVMGLITLLIRGPLINFTTFV